MTLTQSVFSWLGSGSRLTVLIFHRVLPLRDELWPDEWVADEFELVCQWMSEWFQVLPLDEAVERLASGSLPSRAACITFDDGYADNRTLAQPILSKYGLCATFFVSTGFLDGGRMWNDTITETVRRVHAPLLELRGTRLGSLGTLPTHTTVEKRSTLRLLIQSIKYLQPSERADAIAELLQAACVSASELPTDLMMRSEQVLELRTAGMQIGAHTVTHPILARVSEGEVLREIADSRDCLAGLLGEKVDLFAYPNGRPGEDYLLREVAMVKRLGFSAAVSTAPGVAKAATDRFQIPRFTPWDRTRLRFGLRLALQLVSGQHAKVL